MQPSLTVASYNMRKAIGTDRRRDPHRVLNVLKEIDAATGGPGPAGGTVPGGTAPGVIAPGGHAPGAAQ